MNKVFRLMPLITILLMGILLILGACTLLVLVPRCTPVPPTPIPTPTPKSTVFITSNLTIEPQSIRHGDNTVIGVTVTNTGEQPGTYTVVLNINGAVAQTQDVTLDGGASQRVTFDFYTYSQRFHVVTIDQFQGIFEVQSG